MKRYNFNKDNELNLLASNSELRPCLTCIYFDSFDAIVSDAYCIYKYINGPVLMQLQLYVLHNCMGHQPLNAEWHKIN